MYKLLYYHVVITYEKVCGQWCHHEACERFLLLVADIAESSQVVCIHQSHYEDDNSFNSWYSPGCYVEVGAVHFNGFVAPLQSSSQEPCQGQDHPPGRESDSKKSERRGKKLLMCTDYLLLNWH